MKRKYEVGKVEPKRNHLAVLVFVHEVGPMWSIDIKIPYSLIDGREVYEAWEAENVRQVEWEHRQRERLDDSLF